MILIHMSAYKKVFSKNLKYFSYILYLKSRYNYFESWKRRFINFLSFNIRFLNLKI